MLIECGSSANIIDVKQDCKVCGERAAGFHFGAFTCEGCKSFFGRASDSSKPVQFPECRAGGNCQVQGSNRTTCKACRYEKCIKAGMSKSKSRYGRRSNWFKVHSYAESIGQNLGEGESTDDSSPVSSNLPSIESPGSSDYKPHLSSPESDTAQSNKPRDNQNPSPFQPLLTPVTCTARPIEEIQMALSAPTYPIPMPFGLPPAGFPNSCWPPHIFIAQPFPMWPLLSPTHAVFPSSNAATISRPIPRRPSPIRPQSSLTLNTPKAVHSQPCFRVPTDYASTIAQLRQATPYHDDSLEVPLDLSRKKRPKIIL